MTQIGMPRQGTVNCCRGFIELISILMGAADASVSALGIQYEKNGTEAAAKPIPPTAVVARRRKQRRFSSILSVTPRILTQLLLLISRMKARKFNHSKMR